MTQPGAEWVQAVTTYVTGPIGQIFLRLLFMLVIPLLFAAWWSASRRWATSAR
jgi:Na+/H+-dicarboxylate symporter